MFKNLSPGTIGIRGLSLPQTIDLAKLNVPVLVQAFPDEVDKMRRRSVELVAETGYSNFIVDLRQLESVGHGRTFEIYDLGDSFANYEFTVWSNTAVLMPTNQAAADQIEFLHTVEINRGRGVISYVETVDEAFSWFEEMARRTGAR